MVMIMNDSILKIFALVLFVVASAGAYAQSDSEAQQEADGHSTFGMWQSLDLTPVSVSDAMTRTELHGKTVVVRGEITDVCRKKGCWMIVSDGTSQMRITFKDYGFFVPTDSDGRSVVIQGVVSAEEIPEDMAKHYAEESLTEDPDDIEGPQQVITMVATGVLID